MGYSGAGGKLIDEKNQKQKISWHCPFNASLRWLNIVSGVYLTQVFLLLIGHQHLVDFFRYRPLPPIGWRIVQILR